MIELIEGLLLYFKVGINEKDFKVLNLNEVLGIVLKSFSFDLNSNNLNLTIQDLPEILGSMELLKTVFHNLISNAIKYQPKELAQAPRRLQHQGGVRIDRRQRRGRCL